MDHSAGMENDQNDADRYLRKAEEFRDKACATVDPRVKSAMEAVTREFIRKARACDATALRRAGIR
jgi:hypothetical protein